MPPGYRLKQLQRAYAKGEITWGAVAASLQAWNAHAEHGTTWQLRTKVFQEAVFVRRRAR